MDTKIQILDELFNYYCYNNKIDYVLRTIEVYPNRYHAIIDDYIVIHYEIIKEGDLTHTIDPYLFSKRFKLFLSDYHIIGICKGCNINNISLVRLNCNHEHYLCLKCLKQLITIDGLCLFCKEEIILMYCTMYI